MQNSWLSDYASPCSAGNKRTYLSHMGSAIQNVVASKSSLMYKLDSFKELCFNLDWLQSSEMNVAKIHLVSKWGTVVE